MKRFTISIAFFLFSVLMIKGATGFSISCLAGTEHIAGNSAGGTHTDDAEKAPEEKNIQAEEYLHSFHTVMIGHPVKAGTNAWKTVRNTFVLQAVYLSIPEPPPNEPAA